MNSVGFSSLPKDVLWLIFTEVIRTNNFGNDFRIRREWNWMVRHFSAPHSAANIFKGPLSKVLLYLGLINKTTLSLMKSKCIKQGAGWLFKKGALLEC